MIYPGNVDWPNSYVEVGLSYITTSIKADFLALLKNLRILDIYVISEVLSYSTNEMDNRYKLQALWKIKYP